MITQSISQYQPVNSPPPLAVPPSLPPSPSQGIPAPQPPRPTPSPSPAKPPSAYLQPPAADTHHPPATGHPRTVLAQAPAAPSTLGTMAQKVVQELHETPYLDTTPLKQVDQHVRWQTAAIVAVATFFLGAFLAIITMFWFY